MTIEERRADEWRDRRTALLNLYTLEPKAFKRRFKMNRPQFDDIVEKSKALGEVDDFGKEMAERSSGYFVPAALQLAATLRYLASGHHLCQEDNYSLATSTFYKSVWNCLYAIDYLIPDCDFDPKDEGKMRAHVDGMYIRSGRIVPGCVGALDGMVVRINKPSLKDTVTHPPVQPSRIEKSTTPSTSKLSRIRKFIWWSMHTAGFTHKSLAWNSTKICDILREFGLPAGLWIAGDDAYPSSEYLVCPYSLHACR
jgi:hypothetical protein